tara:strand:- start:660 stop:974 length:315 start_codon:yes stop_codon:yes gene_type:complete
VIDEPAELDEKEQGSENRDISEEALGEVHSEDVSEHVAVSEPPDSHDDSPVHLDEVVMEHNEPETSAQPSAQTSTGSGRFEGNTQPVVGVAVDGGGSHRGSPCG